MEKQLHMTLEVWILDARTKWGDEKPQRTEPGDELAWFTENHLDRLVNGSLDGVKRIHIQELVYDRLRCRTGRKKPTVKIHVHMDCRTIQVTYIAEGEMD